MNHTAVPVTWSPTRFSASGQQSYKWGSCKVPCNKSFQTVHHITFPCSRSNHKTRSLSKSNLTFPRCLGPQSLLPNCEGTRHLATNPYMATKQWQQLLSIQHTTKVTHLHNFHGDIKISRLQLKCDGTRWRTGGEVKGKLASGVGSQYSSHYLGTRCIQN